MSVFHGRDICFLNILRFDNPQKSLVYTDLQKLLFTKAFKRIPRLLSFTLIVSVEYDWPFSGHLSRYFSRKRIL